MKAVPTADLTVRYPKDTSASLPQELEATERYFDETHAKSVVVCFFPEQRRQTDESVTSKQNIIGGLIAEKYDGILLPGHELSRATFVASHCAQALRNATLHRGVFLLPLWLLLGRISAGVRNHWRPSRW
jgi:hypothetical protein